MCVCLTKRESVCLFLFVVSMFACVFVLLCLLFVLVVAGGFVRSFVNSLVFVVALFVSVFVLLWLLFVLFVVTGLVCLFVIAVVAVYFPFFLLWLQVFLFLTFCCFRHHFFVVNCLLKLIHCNRCMGC